MIILIRKSSKIFQKTFLALLLFVEISGAWGQTAGFNNTFAILSFNGAANLYYDLNAATLNTDFDGANLGTFNPASNSLTLKGAEHNVWKCNGCDLTSTRLNYRIYSTTGTAGTFVQMNVPYSSTVATGCGQDQVWSVTGNSVNVLSGLAPGTYYLEVFSDATVTCSGGTVYASNNSANYKASFTVIQPLPVELTSFSGNCAEGKVILDWATATEHNSAYFQVEYSRDGVAWQNIEVVAAAGNSVQNINYTLTHQQVASGNNYYRLRQVDIDGVEKLYDVIAVNCAAGSDHYIMTYPNPSEQNFQVALLDENLIGTATLSMVDARGLLIHSELLEVKAGTNLFLFNNTGLAPGIYYVKISKGDYSSEVVKQVVQ